MISSSLAITCEKSSCLHCGQELSASQQFEAFCCTGCKAVHHLLGNLKLSQFYQLRPEKILPQVNYFNRDHKLAWIDEVLAQNPTSLTVGIEGIQCTACVWLISELAKRHGGANVKVDTESGLLHLKFDSQLFALKSYLHDLADLGYFTAPQSGANDTPAQDNSLLLRMGICIAIAMNGMFFAICLYLGLGKQDGLIYQLMTELSMWFSVASVLVGGSYFFERAWLGLKQRIFHYDLPIAIGIVGAFGGSYYLYLSGAHERVYFDTVNAFIALMLTGRYVQNRALQKNRSRLLKTQNLLGQGLVKKIAASVTEIKLDEIQSGDELLIHASAIIPVDMTLLSPASISCNLQWINGEAEPVKFTAGDVVPAGAKIISLQGVRGRALHAYASGPLAKLMLNLGCVLKNPQDNLPTVIRWLGKYYVPAVLSIATVAALFWMIVDPTKLVSVVVSLLVVTCPCGLGLAIPLARTQATKQLLSMGIIAKSEHLLDHFLKVKKIIFDKTGTLTLADLSLVNPGSLHSLANEDIQVIFSAVSGSEHPASRAIYQSLTPLKPRYVDCEVSEIVGQGLTVKTSAGDEYYIGKNRNSSAAEHYQVLIEKNSQTLVLLELQEMLLGDTVSVVQQLKKLNYELYLLSGDKQARVDSTAQQLGISRESRFAECSPTTKAEIVSRLDHQDTLMIGDGINDRLAIERAFLSGTPANHPQHLASLADFYFISFNLSWLTRMLVLAKNLRTTTRFNLGFALIYNAVVVSLAAAGFMTPLICAVIMPVSSLVGLGVTRKLMSRGIWKS